MHAQRRLRCYEFRGLRFHFQGHGALTEDDVREIIRRDEYRARLRSDPLHHRLSLVGGAAAEIDLCPVAFRCGDLGWGADCRHDNMGGRPECAGREGDCLGMVSCKQSTV